MKSNRLEWLKVQTTGYICTGLLARHEHCVDVITSIVITFTLHATSLPDIF